MKSVPTYEMALKYQLKFESISNLSTDQLDQYFLVKAINLISYNIISRTLHMLTLEDTSLRKGALFIRITM